MPNNQQPKMEWEKEFDKKFLLSKGDYLLMERRDVYGGKEQIDKIKSFISTLLSQQRKEVEKELYPYVLAHTRKEVLEEVEKLIIEEMNIAHKEGQPTSRLTSLINKLKQPNQ